PTSVLGEQRMLHPDGNELWARRKERCGAPLCERAELLRRTPPLLPDLESRVMDALVVMVLVQLCVMVPCLVVALIATLRRRKSSPIREGRHRRGTEKVHGVGDSVAGLREREGADELPYYPGG